jgi:hypothetical protein
MSYDYSTMLEMLNASKRNLHNIHAHVHKPDGTGAYGRQLLKSRQKKSQEQRDLLAYYANQARKLKEGKGPSAHNNYLRHRSKVPQTPQTPHVSAARQAQLNTNMLERAMRTSGHAHNSDFLSQNSDFSSDFFSSTPYIHMPHGAHRTTNAAKPQKWHRRLVSKARSLFPRSSPRSLSSLWAKR